MSAESDFMMIRPVTITDTILTSTTVQETVAATYAGGTTYAIGDRAGLAPSVVGDAQLVYQSKTAGNIGNALPVPPATETTHWKYVSSVYPAYSGANTYVLDGIVSSISTNVHLLYRSLVAGNIGNALTDTTKWQAYGATNAHAMFDAVYGSQTSNADTIVIVLTPGVLINSLYLGNVDAASVTVSQSISGWSSTQILNKHPVTNWYDFWYEPLYRETNVVFTDIPPYINGVLTVTIDNTGGTAKCGVVEIGKSVTLGKTQWDCVGSNISYSGTTTDVFGNTTFVPRASAPRLNFEVKILAGFESEAHRLLTLYTDQEMVFIGSSLYGITMVYGFLGTFTVPVSNTGKTASIEVKGLI